MSEVILSLFTDIWSVIPFFIVIAILLLFLGYILR